MFGVAVRTVSKTPPKAFAEMFSRRWPPKCLLQVSDDARHGVARCVIRIATCSDPRTCPGVGIEKGDFDVYSPPSLPFVHGLRSNRTGNRKSAALTRASPEAYSPRTAYTWRPVPGSYGRAEGAPRSHMRPRG